MIPIDSSTSSKASPLLKSNSIMVLEVFEDADAIDPTRFANNWSTQEILLLNCCSQLFDVVPGQMNIVSL